MLSRYKRAVGAFLAIAAGVIFGLANYALADSECGDLTFVEGVGAQDTNGDGLATLEEGSVDIDDDGKFTCVEAQYFGMNCLICWKALGCNASGTTTEVLPNQVCQGSCIGGKDKCFPLTGAECEQTATGCRTP